MAELPVATEIVEPLLEIVAESDSTEIQHHREIYNRNAREVSIMLTITTCMTIFYILYLFLHFF
uniref:Uncharacterized protein n=1 Tax=viral metagenome TaxID=1070528 RepID=A0A6C0B948_9ZZZZ